MSESVSGVAPPALPLLDRPVGELDREEEARGHRRGGGVERAIGDRKLRSVQAARENGCDRDERGSSQDDARDERENRDARDPRADALEDVVAAGNRNRRDPDEARNASDARR
jgi:hypothetical protein